MGEAAQQQKGQLKVTKAPWKHGGTSGWNVNKQLGALRQNKPSPHHVNLEADHYILRVPYPIWVFSVLPRESKLELFLINML